MDVTRPVTPAEIDALLTSVDKPARYIGGEVNAVVKKERVRCRFALGFPDVYEVAESHIGLKILYHILNERPDFAAERVYAQWPDLEGAARGAGVPLWSLETYRPLRLFDVVGFSLQYELSYPTLLGMLDHGGVKLRATQREVDAPFVIGGGAGSYNPEPIAPFFDGFLLGDGEDAVLEIAEVVAAGREAGSSRESILRELALIRGMYIPGFYQPVYRGREIVDIQVQPGTPGAQERSRHGTPRVVRRVLADLDRAPYPTQTIVPNVTPVHDRVAIEIQRGCSQACRFCQAGMITRPTRQRKPETVLDLAHRSLAQSGSDEVGLLSLSAGDYGPINEVLNAFFKRYRDDRIGISLPSMRTESMNAALAAQVATVRKTGFTFAPEAGSERMRRVINKTNSEEDLMQAVRATVQAGWRHLKFYFMIGLPTETEADVDAIAHVGERARAVGREIDPRVDVTVSVSTFVPKPHTAFQWEGQIDVATTRARHQRLRSRLQRQNIGFRYHTPEQSWLEGVLSRGDRRLAEAIERAAQEGARLDAWSEHYDHARWERALRETLAPHGLSPDDYLAPRALDALLPWDHLDAGILKKFLRRDRDRAYREATIEDCAFTEHCYACGGCDLGDPYKRKAPGQERVVALRPQVHDAVADDLPKVAPLRAVLRSGDAGSNATARSRLRFRFAKLGRGIHVSHLDTMEHILRAVRLARVPVVYSQGHNPRPRVGFSPACPTGIRSEAEFFEVTCHGAPEPRASAEAVRERLPDGLLLLDVETLDPKAPSINTLLESTTYSVELPSVSRDQLQVATEAFRASDQVRVRIRRKKRHRVMDARSLVDDVAVVGAALQVTLPFNGGGGALKIGEAVAAVLGQTDIGPTRITKTHVALSAAPMPTEKPGHVGSDGPVLDLTHLYDRSAPMSAPAPRNPGLVVPYQE